MNDEDGAVVVAAAAAAVEVDVAAERMRRKLKRSLLCEAVD